MCERTCAVCGKVITRSDICNRCWRDYANEDGSLPIWLSELIRIQSSFERSFASTKEIAFSNYYTNGEPND